MLKAVKVDVEDQDDLDAYRVTGTLSNGNAVDATLLVETDGREAWWDDERDPCVEGGVEPGFDDTGWDEVLAAIS